MTVLLKHILIFFRSIVDHANQDHKKQQLQLVRHLNICSSSYVLKFLWVCTTHMSFAVNINKIIKKKHLCKPHKYEFTLKYIPIIFLQEQLI